jgi:hypothetical protein
VLESDWQGQHANEIHVVCCFVLPADVKMECESPSPKAGSLQPKGNDEFAFLRKLLQAQGDECWLISDQNGAKGSRVGAHALTPKTGPEQAGARGNLTAQHNDGPASDLRYVYET